MSQIFNYSYDRQFSNILENEDLSVSKFFDAIFGFFYRNNSEILYDNKKHYGKQEVFSIFEKWQNKYQNNTKTNSTSERNCENYDETMKNNEDCWDRSPPSGGPTYGPGGPTYTTNTPTVSRLLSENKNDSMIVTKSVVKEVIKQSNFSAANGSVLDKYAWSQTLEDLEIRLPVSSAVIKGKQVKFKLEYQSMEIAVGEIEPSSFVEKLIGGNLSNSVVVDDCIWLLEPGQYITIILQKTQKGWWNRVFDHEDAIDTTDMTVPERPIGDLPAEEKVAIERELHDRMAKEAGKPTSREKEFESVLRRAWDADDSPFKGQPFDPSIIQNL